MLYKKGVTRSICVILNGFMILAMTFGTCGPVFAQDIATQPRESTVATTPFSGEPASEAIAPLAPALLLPADNAPGIRATPTFSWQAAAGAVAYQFQYDEATDFADPAYTSAVLSELNHTPSPDMPPGTWYWRVKASDAASNWSEWSAYRTLAILPALPPAPVLTAPADATYIRDTTPTFTWLTAERATGYKLQIDNNSDFSSPVLTTATLSATSYTAPTLTPRKYYWRVRARDAAGDWGSYSAPFSFTLDVTAPAVPALSSPANLTRTNNRLPEFTWQASVGASDYVIQLDNNSDFSSPILKTATLSLTNFTPSTELPLGAIYWRVRAQDLAGNWSAYSTARILTIDITPPAVPTLSAPANNTSYRGTPTYSWVASSGAAKYVFEYAATSDFAVPLHTSVEISTLTYKPPAQALGIYFWHVKAKDAAGNWSGWSTARQITVIPPKTVGPVLIAPANLTATNNQTPVFSWNSVPYGEYYRFQISKSSTFSSTYLAETLPAGQLTYAYPTALPAGVYYWRVQAYNIKNEAGFWSAYRTLVIDLTPPSAPTKISPVNGKETNNTTPTFYWSTPSGGKYYIFEIASDADFTAIVFTSTELNTTSYRLETAVAEGSYYWHVKARDAAGNWGNFSSAWLVKIDLTPPAAPVEMTRPLDGARTNNRTPSFSWPAVAEAAGYKVQIDKHLDFGSPNVSAAVSKTGYIPPALSSGLYYWRICARDAAGNWSAYGPVFSFTIDLTPPPVPVLRSPANGVTTLLRKPTFSWYISASAVAYSFRLDDNSDFSSPIISTGTLYGTSYTAAYALPEKQTLYWQVRARDDVGNWSAYSTARMITVNAPPVAPNLISPSNGAYKYWEAEFSWSSVPDGASYEIVVYNPDGSVGFNRWQSDTKILLYNPDYGRWFHWKVRAKDAEGNIGPWSSTWYVFIG